MRDPERIPRITEKLAKLWQHNPDWRLGQLIVNVQPNPIDAWFIEDDDWETAFDVALAEEQ
jgi:hypothetical protein